MDVEPRMFEHNLFRSESLEALNWHYSKSLKRKKKEQRNPQKQNSVRLLAGETRAQSQNDEYAPFAPAEE